MSSDYHCDRECTVYVGSLDRKVSEEIIYELFLQAGPVERVTIPKDKESGIQKNYGFVTFTGPVSVPYAIDLLDGTSLYGQRIAVKPQTGSSTPVNSSNRAPLFPTPVMRGSPMLPQVMRQDSYEQNNYGRYSPSPYMTPSQWHTPQANFQRQNSTGGRYTSQNQYSHQYSHSSHGDYRRSNSYQEYRSHRR